MVRIVNEHEGIEGSDEQNLAEMSQLIDICNSGSGPWPLSQMREDPQPGVYVGSFWDAFEEGYLPSILITHMRRNITLPDVYVDSQQAEDAAMEFVNELLRTANG